MASDDAGEGSPDAPDAYIDQDISLFDDATEDSDVSEDPADETDMATGPIFRYVQSARYGEHRRNA